MDEKNTYPYLSVRWMSALYQNVPVVLVPHGTKVALPVLKSNGTIQRGELLVPDPTPDPNINYETANEWTEARRAALLKWAILLAKSISLEICAVFGSNDTVYVEPSGKKVISTHPPSGGIDAITGGYYREPNLPHTGKVEGQQEPCPETPQIMPPKEPLELYIEKGEISRSKLYLSIPDPDDNGGIIEYPTLREFLKEIEYIDADSDEALWRYISENVILDANELAELRKKKTDPKTLIGNLDEMIDYNSYAAEKWSDQYYMNESPEAFAFHFLEELALDDVPGVDLVEGDRPGSNLTFVEIKDSKALDELQKALAEEGYEVTIKRF